MNIRDRHGRQVPIGRIDENGTVFDRDGYDTGQKVPVVGVPIRDCYGREEPGASVGRDGVVRDRLGRCVPGYSRVD